jgi:hypothetical protein
MDPETGFQWLNWSIARAGSIEGTPPSGAPPRPCRLANRGGPSLQPVWPGKLELALHELEASFVAPHEPLTTTVLVDSADGVFTELRLNRPGRRDIVRMTTTRLGTGSRVARPTMPADMFMVVVRFTMSQWATTATRRCVPACAASSRAVVGHASAAPCRNL